MNVQQFHAGEKAEATVEFIHGDRVGRVTATFPTPTTRPRSSCSPASPKSRSPPATQGTLTGA